jgi:hypothetical protein
MLNRFVTITLCMISLYLFYSPMALCMQGSEETLAGEEVEGALPEICNPCVPEAGKYANERTAIYIWEGSAVSGVGEDIIEAINKAFAESEGTTVEIGEILDEKHGEVLVSVWISIKGSMPLRKILRITRLEKGKEESLKNVGTKIVLRIFLQKKKVGPKAKDTFDPEEIEVLPLEDGEQCVVLIWYLE